MIFAGLVLLAMYLPTRAALQRATQYAATAIATESSDAWLRYDYGSMSYYWETDKGEKKNVYAALFSGIGDVQAKGEAVVREMENRQISSKSGTLSVKCDIVNRLIYKEVLITATREFPTPINLSFIGFPDSVRIDVTSTAVVQNGDEFMRNMDLAADFVVFILETFGLTVTEGIAPYVDKARGFLGIG
jgi:hypothetical protein